MKKHTKDFKAFSLTENEGGFSEGRGLLPVSVLNLGEPAAGYVIMLDGRPAGLVETQEEAQDLALEIGEEIYPGLSYDMLELGMLLDGRIEIQEVGISDIDELRTKIDRINKTKKVFGK